MAKEKTMEQLLEKVSIEKLKSVGVNDTEIAKVEALHDLLKKGKTWKDKEVRHLFGVLPDSFPFCQAYIHNEALIRIGKAKPIKVVPIPGEKDSRKKWVPIEKADEMGAITSIPIKGYEIFCASCGNIFIGKEPFHQNFCSDHSGKSTPKKDKAVQEQPQPSPEKELDKPEDKPKKRRGRPKKSESEKSPAIKAKPKARRGRPPKKDSGKKAITKKSSPKPKGSPSRPTKKKGLIRKKK